MNEPALKSKIIVADDHPIFRSGVKNALIGLPFIEEISEAANGEEVIRLLDHKHYNIVLMDIKMEPMGGIEATEIITARFPMTKVIALSMHDCEEHIMAMLEKGAAGYLIKNADREEMETAIKEVIDGRPYYSKEVSKALFEHVQRLKNAPEQTENEIQKERIRDITFLTCHEFTNQEIADALFLSTRTIEGYRRQAYKAANTDNIIALIKYGIENKIIEDESLKKKFSKALNQKKKTQS
jgi:two-component system response regulator NreC